MNYELTIFKNTFDNKTHRTMSFDTWDAFESLLYSLSKTKGEKGGYNSSPLISPSAYIPDSTRANKNVVRWCSWAAVDVDSMELHGRDLLDTLHDICGQYYYVCYSTASSRVEQPKFRLVFPLTEDVPAENIKHFWFALNTLVGMLGDKQTKDLSRMFYVPAVYPDAYNFIFTNKGEIMNPKKIMNSVEYTQPTGGIGSSFMDRLPVEMQQHLINYRKDQATNTGVTWTSYRNCPFFPKRLGIEYSMISETGWYAKMYAIMIATAGNAIKNGYPITAKEIAKLCSELDKETGNWYENRPLELEADGAIEYVYRNN
jgi:hypothetical protein